MEDFVVMTSKQFGDIIGVSVTTLSNWEKKGILVPSMTTPTGRRVYTQEQVDAYLAQDFNNPILTGKHGDE